MYNTNRTQKGKNMKKLNTLTTLFITFLKIGLFTFGGGYSMIALIEKEIVEKKKWLTQNELLDIIAIAESTPGPIAINCATYIGYKVKGIIGSIISTIAVIIPSFIIIYIISLFLKQFLQIKYVAYAFKGIAAGVIYLILRAGLKMFKELEKNFLNLTLFIITIILMIIFSILSIKFSSIYYILISALIGLILYLINTLKHQQKEKK